MLWIGLTAYHYKRSFLIILQNFQYFHSSFLCSFFSPLFKHNKRILCYFMFSVFGKSLFMISCIIWSMGCVSYRYKYIPTTTSFTTHLFAWCNPVTHCWHAKKCPISKSAFEIGQCRLKVDRSQYLVKIQSNIG